MAMYQYGPALPNPPALVLETVGHDDVEPIPAECASCGNSGMLYVERSFHTPDAVFICDSCGYTDDSCYLTHHRDTPMWKCTAGVIWMEVQLRAEREAEARADREMYDYIYGPPDYD